MKHKISLTILLALFVTTVAHAGDKIGNGGGLWTCQSQNAIKWATLVDLFEAQNEFQLKIPPVQTDLNAEQILDLKIGWLATNYSQLYQLLQPYIEPVKDNIVYVNGQLEIVDDALYRLKPAPESCPGGQIVYAQFANFTNYGKILIAKDLWNSKAVSELDKAALVLHEIVYKMMREKFADKSSVRARRIVGILFSNLSAKEMRKQVKGILNPSNGGNGDSGGDGNSPQPQRYPKPGDQFNLNFDTFKFQAEHLPDEVIFTDGSESTGFVVTLETTDPQVALFSSPIEIHLNRRLGPKSWYGETTTTLTLPNGTPCTYPISLQINMTADESNSYVQFLLVWPQKEYWDSDDPSSTPQKCSDLLPSSNWTEISPLPN